MQVPFLQYFFKDFKIVPIAIGLQDYETVKEVAERADLRALTSMKKHVVIVASSDFTHYEDVDVAKRRTTYLIGHIEKLDVPGFYDELANVNSTCCGYGPIAATMMACKHERRHSGGTTGLCHER